MRPGSSLCNRIIRTLYGSIAVIRYYIQVTRPSVAVNVPHHNSNSNDKTKSAGIHKETEQLFMTYLTSADRNIQLRFETVVIMSVDILMMIEG